MSREWIAKRSCKGIPTGFFFRDDPTEALALCAACPVKTECLWATLDVEEGVTGGVTAATRAAMRKRMLAKGTWDSPPVDLGDRITNHGTTSGYRQHCRLGVPPCHACRWANNEKNRTRTRRKVAA